MFIGRRGDNSIYGLWTVRQWNGQEELPDTDPQVIAFLASIQITPAEIARKQALDDSINTATIGAAQPATLSQLKGMAVEEYLAWFDVNFDTAAKLIALLKRIVLIIIRRVA